MPVLMSMVDMQDLAKKLAKMRLWRAKWTAYGMDKKSTYDMWRVAVGSEEFHTRMTLPTKGIRIIFIERKQEGTPNAKGLVKVKFSYTEARVEPVPVHPHDTQPDYMAYT